METSETELIAGRSVVRPRGFGKLLALALAACATVLAVAPANAAFHIMVISEVFAGSTANPNAQYVELEMRFAGQNQVQGHSVIIYNAAGTQVGSSTFAGPVANSANMSSILVATVEAQTVFGLTADLVMTTAAIPRTGGKACFDTIDCVAWGNYTGSGPAGAPFSGTEGLLPGSSATRTGPDSGDSAADFAFAKPSPRTNGGASGAVGCAPGFASAATSVAEDAGSAVITVNGCPSSTVSYSTADGSATAGSDYTAVSGTLTFDAAGTSQTFSIPITADPASEPTETVKLRIRNQSTEFLGRADATLSITNVTPPPTPPSAPLNLTANASPGQIALAWQAPSSSGSAAITGYRIYRGTTSGTETFLTAVGNVLTFNDSALPGGATRFYQVSAFNGAEGPRSNEASATTTLVPPAAPANVLAQPGSGVGQIRITWSSPPSTGGSPVTKYHVYRADVLIATVNAPSLTFTDSGRQPLQSHTYRVSASNAVGEGAKSAESCTKPFPWHAALGCLF